MLGLPELEAPSAIQQDGGEGQVEVGQEALLEMVAQVAGGDGMRSTSALGPETGTPPLGSGCGPPLPKMPVWTLGRHVGRAWHWGGRSEALLGGAWSLPPWPQRTCGQCLLLAPPRVVVVAHLCVYTKAIVHFKMG